MPTIFGFNTDVKVGDTVFHVQSEAREKELLLETQVFVSGRCVGKRASSYADRYAEPDFSAERMHELLKAQHKEVLDAVRAGRAEEALKQRTEGGLTVEWTNAEAVIDAGTTTVQILVRDGDSPASGARVIVRFDHLGDPTYAQAVSDGEGRAEVTFPAEFGGPSGAETVGIIIQAGLAGRTATRRFRLRRT